MRLAATLSVLASLAAGLLAAGCSDPIHDGGVSALGKDTRAPGTEFHRAGQPCGVCHQASGPASTTFTVAGTIFSQPGTFVGLNGVQLEFTDSNGNQYVDPNLTNCVGNFFVKDTDWNPFFPILVRITKAGVAQTMISQIGREASCAHCHALQNPDPLSQVGHVYLGLDDPMPPTTCGANPDLTQ
jgi:hypothetical protein